MYIGTVIKFMRNSHNHYFWSIPFYVIHKSTFLRGQVQIVVDHRSVTGHLYSTSFTPVLKSGSLGRGLPNSKIYNEYTVGYLAKAREEKSITTELLMPSSVYFISSNFIGSIDKTSPLIILKRNHDTAAMGLHTKTKPGEGPQSKMLYFHILDRKKFTS